MIEQWRVHYNTERPHSSLGYRPPAPETKVTLLPAPLRYTESREVRQPPWYQEWGQVIIVEWDMKRSM